MNLDYEHEKFRESLIETVELVTSLYKKMESLPVYSNPDILTLREKLYESLPTDGQPVDDILKTIERSVLPNATLNISPNFFASIIGGGSQAGIIAEMLIASLNQNCSLWYRGPSAAELERLVISWLAEFIGFATPCGGILTSGGTAATLFALAVARKKKAPFDIANEGMSGGKPMTVYISQEGHSSIDKVIDLLGFGRKYLRKIPINDDFTINCDALIRQIDKDRENDLIPIAVIGNGGTGNTGTIDPLDSLADICKSENLWFHIDAAYGGAAAKVPSVAEKFKGLNRADSVAIDPQKWLHVPFEAGCVLLKDQKALKETFSLLPSYLKSGFGADFDPNYMEEGMQLTRSFRALKVWFVFKAYGAEKLRQSIADNISNMRRFAELVSKSDDFELLADGDLSIVCCRYRTMNRTFWKNEEYLNSLNKELLGAIIADGRFLIASSVINGSFALRIANVNHRAEFRHLQELFEHIRSLGEKQISEIKERGE